MGSLFQLTADTILPPAGARIIKAADAATLLSANALLAAARERADGIVRTAETVFEQRKAEGYAQGLEEGRAEHAEKLMETAMASVAFIEGMERTLVEVIGEALRKIVGDMDANERIVLVVRNALNGIRGQQTVTLRVAPDDEPAVRRDIAALLDVSGRDNGFLRMVADPRLQRGACLLESELGVVDAGVETQLLALEKLLKAQITI